MHAIIIFLLVLLLLILVPVLILGLVAYAKLKSIWYKLTGRPQPNNPFGNFSGGFGNFSQQANGNSGAQQNTTHQEQQHTSTHTNTSNGNKKIFSADEGEYVDFEVVD